MLLEDQKKSFFYDKLQTVIMLFGHCTLFNSYHLITVNLIVRHFINTLYNRYHTAFVWFFVSTLATCLFRLAFHQSEDLKLLDS